MGFEAVSWIDYLLMGIIAVGMPVWGYMVHLRDLMRVQAGTPTPRLRTYAETQWFLWTPALSVLLVWVVMDRSWSLLGLSAGAVFLSYAAWFAVLAGVVFLTVQVVQAKTSRQTAEKVVKLLSASPRTVAILPHSPREALGFTLLSVTAGFTEEILFRGFLIAALAFFMPVWAAAALSLLVFVLAHLYQEELSSLLKVGLTGLLLILVYLWSGSLWPAIVLHAALDVAAGLTWWFAYDTTNSEPLPQT